MVPKTERFEMRLDPETIEHLDAWRANQSDVPSRAEAIRRLIHEGVFRSSKKDFRLTDAEKLMTWMLAEILKSQKGYDDKKTADLIQEAIGGGHFWALQWELPGILHEHVDDRKAVSLVVDTLDMWDCIERAYQTFGADEKKRLKDELDVFGDNPRFYGFDGNYEGEYMSITRFLVDQLGRFQRFKGRDYNSHFPMVERYRRMTALFEPMRVSLVGRDLSAGEVIQLLKRD